PQVHDEVHVAGQVPDEVLAAPGEPLDAPPRDRPLDLGDRQGQAPARIGDAQRAQHAALDARGQLAADRLDLRQLWHGLPALRAVNLRVRFAELEEKV